MATVHLCQPSLGRLSQSSLSTQTPQLKPLLMDPIDPKTPLCPGPSLLLEAPQAENITLESKRGLLEKVKGRLPPGSLRERPGK